MQTVYFDRLVVPSTRTANAPGCIMHVMDCHGGGAGACFMVPGQEAGLPDMPRPNVRGPFVQVASATFGAVLSWASRRTADQRQGYGYMGESEYRRRPHDLQDVCGQIVDRVLFRELLQPLIEERTELSEPIFVLIEQCDAPKRAVQLRCRDLELWIMPLAGEEIGDDPMPCRMLRTEDEAKAHAAEMVAP